MHSLFHRFLRRTHFWRSIGFVELSELYAARVLRTLAMGMIGGFVAIFLYQEGYSLLFIGVYFILYFLVRALASIPSAFFVARFGPKHGTMVSNILFIPSMISLTTTPIFGLWSLGIFLVLNSFSRTLYEICHLVNFSKVKHIEHAGKEIGIMQIVDRMTTALSPLLGGLIAFAFGPQVMIIIAAVILSLAAGPLFYTSEPVKTHQKIFLRGLSIKKIWRNIIASIAVGVDSNISGFQWYLFIFVVIIGASGGNEAYAQIGALGSVALLSGLATAHIFGRVIDKRRGGDLLRYSVIGTAILHFIRPFIQSPAGVAVMNITNEVSTTGYTMPYLKGLFAAADDLPGYRIVYVSIIAAAVCIGDTIAVTTFTALVFLMGDIEGFKSTYLVLAPVTLLIAFHGFAIYKERSFLANLVRA